jgi:hypothetical protein
MAVWTIFITFRFYLKLSEIKNSKHWRNWLAVKLEKKYSWCSIMLKLCIYQHYIRNMKKWNDVYNYNI